jgi:hypothetical protein
MSKLDLRMYEIEKETFEDDADYFLLDLEYNDNLERLAELAEVLYGNRYDRKIAIGKFRSELIAIENALKQTLHPLEERYFENRRKELRRRMRRYSYGLSAEEIRQNADEREKQPN